MRELTQFLPDPGDALDSLGFAILCGAITFFAGMVVGTGVAVALMYWP